YRESRDSLKRDAAAGLIEGRRLTPSEAQTFRESGSTELFERAGEHGDRQDYYVSRDDGVFVYTRQLRVPLDDNTRQIREAHQALENSGGRDLRRGFNLTLLAVAAA